MFPVLGHEDGQNTDLSHLGELWRHWLPSEAVQTFERGKFKGVEIGISLIFSLSIRQVATTQLNKQKVVFV